MSDFIRLDCKSSNPRSMRFLLRPWSRLIVDDLRPDFYELGEKARRPECTSLAWSADGQILFAGFSDNLVRVWVVVA